MYIYIYIHINIKNFHKIREGGMEEIWLKYQTKLTKILDLDFFFVMSHGFIFFTC